MKDKRGISGSTLKILAIVSMLIDHSAAVLISRMLITMEITSVGDYSPSYIGSLFETEGALAGGTYLAYQIMRRVIGRLAFPIFCFLLVEGFQKTHDKRKYACRLMVFAILSEVPFDLAFHGTAWYPQGQNVFFTLLIGLLLMSGFWMLEEKKPAIWIELVGKVVIFAVAAGAAELFQSDYGAKGIAAIALLYLFRKNKVEQVLAGCVAFCWKLMALPAFIPIAFYNGKKGLKLKYVFYAFYPVHLIILYVIAKVWFG